MLSEESNNDSDDRDKSLELNIRFACFDFKLPDLGPLEYIVSESGDQSRGLKLFPEDLVGVGGRMRKVGLRVRLIWERLAVSVNTSAELYEVGVCTRGW